MTIDIQTAIHWCLQSTLSTIAEAATTIAEAATSLQSMAECLAPLLQDWQTAR